MKTGTGEYTYELIDDFAKLPEGQTFGLISRVTTDSQSRLYVFQRKDPAVLVFDSHGKFLHSWGGEFKRPHGFKIVGDRAYLVDQVGCKAMIYTLDGKLLKTIGTGQPSDTGCEDWHNLPLRAAGPFNHPTELMPGPSGDLYVTDGYRNSRVHRFDKEGQLIQSWGQPGKTAPGDFHLPHSLAISPDDGTLYVCDRANARVQMFTPDGKYIGMWTGMGGPNDIARDKDGIFYFAEQKTDESGPAISVRDGKGAVLARWETPPVHGMGIDSAGNIYAGLTGLGRVNKYVRLH